MSEDNKELTVENFYSAINPKAVLGMLDFLHDLRNLIDAFLADMSQTIAEASGEKLPDNVSQLHIPGQEDK